MKNIEEIKNIIAQKVRSINQFFTNTETIESKDKVGSKKLINVILVAFILFGSFIVMLFIIELIACFVFKISRSFCYAT
jgi:hypothetical protein